MPHLQAKVYDLNSHNEDLNPLQIFFKIVSKKPKANRHEEPLAFEQELTDRRPAGKSKDNLLLLSGVGLVLLAGAMVLSEFLNGRV